MKSQLLKSVLVRNGETQKDLADAMGLSQARLSLKINETDGAVFNRIEIDFIKKRYKLSAVENDDIFFSE